MKRIVTLILLGIWVIANYAVSYAEDNPSFCEEIFERCRDKVLSQDLGFIAKALALQECDLYYDQCVVVFNFLYWFLRFLPFVSLN